LIALDTSAVIAIGLREPGWEDLFMVLSRERDSVMSAVTLAEIMVVATRREIGDRMPSFLATIGSKIMPVDRAAALRAADIYARWGKGVHPAALNFCDCFSYDVARQYDCPLLFVGNDFSQTYIVSAIAL